MFQELFSIGLLYLNRWMVMANDTGAARELVILHEKAFQQLDAYANVRLLIENLMLTWPRVNLTGSRG